MMSKKNEKLKKYIIDSYGWDFSIRKEGDRNNVWVYMLAQHEDRRRGMKR